MRVTLRASRPTAVAILLCLVAFFVYWRWTHYGPTGELRPSSSMRVLFPIWTHTALDTSGFVWAAEGDTILIDYEVKLESGYFSLTVGKARWPYRGRRLRHEASRSLRGTAAGQLSYAVREPGRHAIWAGKYSVWSGEARVRWSLRPGSP